MKAFVRPRFKLAMAGAALLVLAVAASTALPGKPPTTSPPVLYNIQIWTAPNARPVGQVNKMNNLGQIVGYYETSEGERRAFLYNPMYDSNGNPTATEAIDVNTIAAAPDVDGRQMVIASAACINDNGVIVGYLQPAGTYLGDIRKVYVLDTRAETPTLVLLAEPPGAFAVWLRINNNGDILEQYNTPDNTSRAYVISGTDGSVTDLEQLAGQAAGPLNNHAQVAGNYPAYRWTLPATFEPIGGTDTYTTGINDSGTVCGRTYAKPPKGGRAQTYPCRWNGGLEVLFGVPGSANAINSANDLFVGLVGSLNGKLYVYQNTKASFFAVDSLIDPSDPDLTTWSNRSGNLATDMTDAVGATGFGQLAGSIMLSDGSGAAWWGYLLTPHSP